MKNQEANSNQFKVIIVGGGPIGIACALECEKAKLKYLVLEKGALTNSLYNYPKNMNFFSTSEKLEIDEIPFISNNEKPNRDEALEYYRRVAVSNSLKINLYENVVRIEKIGEQFNIETDKSTYTSAAVILATGFYDIPKYLDIKGEELPKVTHYYKEAHKYVMQHTVIVGASNSAVDAALEIWRKGGNVTMVVRGAEIGKRVKYWVRPNIINRIEEGSIKAYFNANLKEIKTDSVIIETPDGEVEIKNDYVIALTGYRPDFEFLKSIGVDLVRNEKCIPQYNEDTMESNIENLYLAGVICGGMETHKWFIENSRIHAKMIIKDLKSKVEV